MVKRELLPAILATCAILAVFTVASARARNPFELALYLCIGVGAVVAIGAVGLAVYTRRGGAK